MSKVALGKRPRQYAADIANLPTRKQRLAALEKAPKRYQALIKKHVELAFMARARS